MHVRWVVKRDMPDVISLEYFHNGSWREEDFMLNLRQRNCIGMVAEGNDGTIMGFMIYELLKVRLHIKNLKAVNHETVEHLVTKLQSKLSTERRNCLTWNISETNIKLLQLLKNKDFRAVSLLRNTHEEDGISRDSVAMQYKLITENAQAA